MSSIDAGTQAVDAVYTWVNQDDPGWQRLYEAATGKELPGSQAHRTANNVARFQSRDELLYSIQSVRRYAPWIRHIYVVSNCALPPALARDSGVTAVPHEAVFPDPAVLPCFNSRAIESNLHRIEGLSERFLYFNDDFFLCRDTAESDFFSPDGKAYLFPYQTPIPYGKTEGLTPVEHGQLNACKLLIEDFGLQPQMKLHHAPYPLRRSTLLEIEERYSDLVSATRTHKFRDSRDIPLATTMHAYYSLARGYGEIREIEARYVDIGDPLFLLLIHPLAPLRRGKYLCFCLNEKAGMRYFGKLRDRIVDRFLRDMLGELAPE